MMKYIALVLAVVLATAHGQAERPCRRNCKDLIGAGECAGRDCLTPNDFYYCERTCGGCTVCEGSPEACDPGCRDAISSCGIFTAHCNDLTTRLGIQITYSLCRAHCQVCTACAAPPAAPTLSPCQSAEECRDEIATDRCEANSLQCGSRNPRFTRSCRRTCGVCQVCALPPTIRPCTRDCKDINPTSLCAKYREACGDSYRLFTSRCQKTCGIARQRTRWKPGQS